MNTYSSRCRSVIHVSCLENGQTDGHTIRSRHGLNGPNLCPMEFHTFPETPYRVDMNPCIYPGKGGAHKLLTVQQEPIRHRLLPRQTDRPAGFTSYHIQSTGRIYTHTTIMTMIMLMLMLNRLKYKYKPTRYHVGRSIHTHTLSLSLSCSKPCR